jgi:tetratricopeptide (TPR) repeat protein
VAELGREALGEAVDEAVGQRLLARVESAAEHVRFAHGLVREVMYERAKSGVRARLHRRTAHALEARGAPHGAERLSALAHHYGRAVLGGDTRKAIHYALRAGERALASYAFEDAAAHFDAALDALEAEDSLDAARACQSALAATRAHELCNRHELAVARAGRAIELARKSRSARLFREAVIAASEIRPAYVRDPRLVALIDEALAAADDRDLATRAQLVSHRAMMALLDGDPVGHARGSRQAEDLARAARDASALLEALRVRSYALNRPETEAEWRACCEERIALARQLDDPFHEFKGRVQRLELSLQVGDTSGFAADLSVLGEMAERVRSPHMEADLHYTRAGVAIACGPLGEARRLAERAFAFCRRVDLSESWAVAQLQLGTIAVDEDRALEVQPEIRRGTVSHAQIFLFRAAEIYLLSVAGAEAAARSRLRELAREGLANVPRDISYPLSLANLSQTCAALAEREVAEALLDRLRPYAGRNLTLMSYYSAGAAGRFLGLNLSCLGRWGEADAQFEAALALDRTSGARVWEAHAALDWARSQRQRGGAASTARARELAREALASAEALGIRRLAREARALLAGRRG